MSGGEAVPDGPWDSIPAMANADWSREVVARVALARHSFFADGIEDVLVLFPEGVFFATKRRGTPIPTSAVPAFTTMAIDDRKARRSMRRLRWDEIASVACSYRFESGALPRDWRRLGRDLAIHPLRGEPIRMFLPHDEATRILEVARFHLGDRVEEAAEPFAERSPMPRFRLREMLLAAIPVFSLVLVWAMCIWITLACVRGWLRLAPGPHARASRRRLAVVVASLAAPATLTIACILAMLAPDGTVVAGVRLAAFVAAVASASIAAPLVLFLGRVAVLSWNRARIEEFPPLRRAQWQWFERLCQRWPVPLRGRGMGWALKSLGIAVLLATWILIGLVDLGKHTQRVHTLGLAVALLPIYLGYRNGASSVTRLRRRDTRAPILFLRSFQDDGCGSFNLTDWRATLLGVQSIRSAGFLGPLANANPIRIFRLLIGRAGDTAEEQLAVYFRKHGPFIAIGRPNEGLPTTGAAREYVSDQVWRSRVESWMGEARLVVIQPGATGGIWWEIQRALGSLPRERILFCLLSFDHRDDDYESFALRLRSLLGVDVPLYRGSALFLHLEGDRIIRTPIQYSNPLVWPRSGCTASLKAMIGPRLGERPEPPLSRRWWPGRVRFDLMVACTALLWSFLANIVPAIAITSTGVAAGLYEWMQRDRAPFGDVRQPLSWGGLEWSGSDLFEESGTQGYAYRFESDFVGQVEIGGYSRTLNGLPSPLSEQDLAAEVVRIFLLIEPRAVADRSIRQVNASGIEWTEHRRGFMGAEGEPCEIVVRVARHDGRLLAHWATRSLEKLVDSGPAFDALIDSVRPGREPVEGTDFTFGPGQDWRPCQLREAEWKAWSNPDGGRIAIQIEAAARAPSTQELRSAFEQRAEQAFAELGLRKPIGVRERERRRGPRAGPGTILTAESVMGSRLMYEQTIYRRGWIYRIVAETRGGEGEIASLGSALEELQVR